MLFYIFMAIFTFLASLYVLSYGRAISKRDVTVSAYGSLFWFIYAFYVLYKCFLLVKKDIK